MNQNQPPVAMTIAATDSGGAAGVAADLKTFAAHGVHGVFAVTAVTAQNTHEVRSVETISPSMLRDQIETVSADFEVAAVKTGLLFGAAAGRVIAERLRGRPNVVVDPVLVSRTGRPLMEIADIVGLYRTELFPSADVITPNYAEAGVLVGGPIRSMEDVEAAATELAGDGPDHVVVTGWLEGEDAVDIHVADGVVTTMAAPLVRTTNVHGTGCSFSATVTAHLARGEPAAVAIDRAKSYVHSAIAGGAGWRLGSGAGPIDHLGFAES